MNIIKTEIYQSPADVKAEIRSYYDNSSTHYGRNESDCFMPWFFHRICTLSEGIAKNQSSDGSEDFGIDGFFIEETQEEIILHIIQAKDTEIKSEILSAIKEFCNKSIPKLSEIINDEKSDNYNENKVIKNLRSQISKLTKEQKENLKIHFFVIHRLNISPEEITSYCIDEINQLKEFLGVTFPNIFMKDDFFLAYKAPQIIKQDDWIYVEGSFLKQYPNQIRRIFFGVASLFNIIRLYDISREALFEENVRFFISSNKNTKEEGPVGNMWQTIKHICLTKTRNPEDFTIFHNGLSICCDLIEGEVPKIRMVNPKIVNGCQTIKGLWLKRFNDPKEKKIVDKFDDEQWKSIKIPIRIIETSRIETIYEVAINNNRQNGNDSTALRSNDEFQRKLKEKLARRGIFYERQKEEYKNASKDDKDFFEKYKNTANNAPIRIQEISQALAASLGHIDYAANPAKIFENSDIYKKLFYNNKGYPLYFIVGLYNLSCALGPALLIAKKEIIKYSELNPKTLKWSVLYLTISWICKEEKKYFLNNFSQMTFKPSDIKDDILRILKRSGVLQIIHEVYIKDQNETTREALQKAVKKLFPRQDDIDIFEGWDEEYIKVIH